jgi:hypothetical protein
VISLTATIVGKRHGKEFEGIFGIIIKYYIFILKFQFYITTMANF